MEMKKKIIEETTFRITKSEKESLDILVEYCETHGCSDCQFKEMCSEAEFTLAGRIERFLDIVEIEG